MNTEVVIYVLTALAAVAILLTRLRLRGDSGGAGRLDIGSSLVNVHFTAGVLALIGWLAYLFAGDRLSDSTRDVVGIVALAFWWIVVIAGLLILSRWLPSHGRHAASAREDTWSEGPGLSVLAHVGMLVGVGVFTWAYLLAKV